MVQARTDTRFLRDMLVALQVIDNLCNALNSVGTDQLLVVGVGPGGAITVTATDLDIRNLSKVHDELYAVLRTDGGAHYDARDRSWNLGALDVPDLSSRAARLLGVIYGSRGAQIQQRAATLEVLVQLATAGIEYDARQAQLQLPATAPLTTPLSGRTPVPGAGVRVQLPNRPCIAASIKALPGNTGYIYLGDNTVAAANGHVLAADCAVNVAIDNLNRFWIDADVNGEGVSHLIVS